MNISLVFHLCASASARCLAVRTPAYEHVSAEVAVFREHHQHQQVVQIQALHQQPVVVGSDTVLHEHLSHAAAGQRLTNVFAGRDK